MEQLSSFPFLIYLSPILCLSRDRYVIPMGTEYDGVHYTDW